MFLALIVPAALANDTGGLRFAYSQSAAAPAGVSVLAPRDEVKAGESRELLRLVSFDDTRMALDVLPPALGAAADPTCKTGHADGYLALQALAWHGTTTYDTVQIVDQGLDVASRSSSHTATPRTERVTTGDFALSAQTTQAGVRATYTLEADASWAIVGCEGATLRSWTQRRTVTRVAEAASRRAADAQIDVDAVRHVEGVGALATAARESLSRGRGDIVTRTYFDSGTPEMEAAARLLHGPRPTDWRDRMEATRERFQGADPGPTDAGWAAARTLWSRLRDGDSRRVAAMARYNLALAAEREGDLATAAAEARAAGEVLRLPWIATYAAEMEALAAIR